MTMIALTPPGRDRSLIKFIYYTGARVGEVARLTWRDFVPTATHILHQEKLMVFSHSVLIPKSLI
ncbi:site-specific integrase [Fischerella sp. PCC 9605]|uniref:site-specific integrase n=1 Tax=Fischerella sp. PCC 9605 TaxID=1173024 RepID=UPI000907C0F3